MKRILMFIFLIFTLIFTSSPLHRLNAEEIKYSDVLVDLNKASDFDSSIYQRISNDNNIYLIQIGESKNNELFIYTYQPSHYVKDLVLNEILISYGLGNKTYTSKNLKLVSNNGVFDKYLVEDFIVPTDQYRYYNIIEVERKFDSSIDSVEGNIVNNIAIPVGETWCCYYQNEKLIYEVEELQYIEITPTITDYIYFKDGFTIGSLVGLITSCDAHYIAFNCENYIIDKIIDADIDFVSTPMKTVTTVDSFTGSSTAYYNTGESISQTITLSESDTVSYVGNGLFDKHYSWNRIMKASDFVNELDAQGVDWNRNEKEILENSQWVFSFVETNATQSTTLIADDGLHSIYTVDHSGTSISKVDVIRIQFTSGKDSYNLGVVSNETSDDGKPGAIGSPNDSLSEIWEQIEDMVKQIKSFGDLLMLMIKIIGLILAVALIIYLLIMFFKLIPIHKWLAALIVAPFTYIKKTYSKKNKRKKE